MATPIYEFAQLPRASVLRSRPTVRDALRQAGDAPRVGVIYNPRSHRNQGADFDCEVCPHVHIAKPGNRSALFDALAKLAAEGIDLLVINGGDGTVRDVLTCGQGIFGDDWPVLAVLPKGKTNALTVDLGVPMEWGLQDAIDAFESGSRIVRRPIAVRDLQNASPPDTAGPDTSEMKADVLGFILGAGAFTAATQDGQSAHKLGAFNSVVVAVTSIWGLMQALLAPRSNPWRRGSRMAIWLGSQKAPMVHSGTGDPRYRQLLFTTTLERLPAGLKPFGRLRGGLKLLAVDQISRRTTMLVPMVATGRMQNGLRERGIHQVSASEFTLEIEDQFIFDGEAFPAGHYRIGQGPLLEFVTPKPGATLHHPT